MSLLVDCRHCGRPECHGECVAREAPATVERPRAKSDLHELPRCPTPNPFSGSSCKRWICPWCAPRQVRSAGAVVQTALDHYAHERGLEDEQAAFVMFSVTPPGSDRLPWACTKNHVHNGAKYGCQVEKEAADAWCKSAVKQWARLRGAAKKHVERMGLPVPALVLERFWEPQKRGVVHLHGVAGVATDEEYEAANAFVHYLSDHGWEYGFGFVDRGPQQADGERRLPKITALAARAYLVSYLTGRNPKNKSSMRDNIRDERMPRSLWWVTPTLTSTSTSERIARMRERLQISRGTGVTMRVLRYVRWYFAARRGQCEVLPRCFGKLLFDVAGAAVLLEPKKARAPGETDEQAFDHHVRLLRAMRRIQPAFDRGPRPVRMRASALAPAAAPVDPALARLATARLDQLALEFGAAA